METGFSPTVFVGIGIAIAVAINLMYTTEPRSKEPDPYDQYGGTFTLYLLGPTSTLLALIT